MEILAKTFTTYRSGIYAFLLKKPRIPVSFAFLWIKQDFWGAIVLSIDFSQSVDKKANVPYPAKLASKGLDLSIERFSGSIGAPSFKVI